MQPGVRPPVRPPDRRRTLEKRTSQLRHERRHTRRAGAPAVVTGSAVRRHRVWCERVIGPDAACGMPRRKQRYACPVRSAPETRETMRDGTLRQPKAYRTSTTRGICRGPPAVSTAEACFPRLFLPDSRGRAAGPARAARPPPTSSAPPARGRRVRPPPVPVSKTTGNGQSCFSSSWDWR